MKQGRVDILDIVDIPRYLGDGGVVVGVDEVDVVWSPADHEDGHHQREHLHYLLFVLPDQSRGRSGDDHLCLPLLFVSTKEKIIYKCSDFFNGLYGQCWVYLQR